MSAEHMAGRARLHAVWLLYTVLGVVFSGNAVHALWEVWAQQPITLRESCLCSEVNVTQCMRDKVTGRPCYIHTVNAASPIHTLGSIEVYCTPGHLQTFLIHV